MPTRLKSLFSPPVFAGEELSFKASLLNTVVWLALIVSLLFIPVFLLASASLALFGILISTFLVLLGTRYLIYIKRIKEASLLLTLGGWLVLFLPAFFQGGLASPFALFSVVIVTLAVLLLGAGYGILLGSMTVAALSVMLLLDYLQLLPEGIPIATPAQHWFNLIIVTCLAGILSYLVMRFLGASNERAREKENQLAESSKELQDARSTLAQHVAERASSLEQRTRLLTTSLEIANAIAVVRDLDRLLNDIISLIVERFGYDKVGIFLADRSGKSLVFRASNSETGKRMIERGFTLKVDQSSAIGNAADTLHSQLVRNVSQGEFFLPGKDTPDLESTSSGLSQGQEARAELALPLISGGRMIGVLDVQSKPEIEPEFIQVSSKSSMFDPENIAILQTLAENIAEVVENVQLLTEKEETIEAIKRAYSSMSRETWQKLLRSQPEFGYLCTRAGEPVIATGVWSPEMLEARDTGEMIHADEFTLAIPIKIRDQVTGVVKVRKPEATGGWSDGEINLVETLSERLGTALESAQLYDETKRRAERERLTGEITARVRASNDPQTILQTAVRELRRALQADQAQLLVQSSPEQTGSGAGPGKEPAETLFTGKTEDGSVDRSPDDA